METELKASAQKYGPGSTYYLNGDELTDHHSLFEAIRNLLPQFHSRTVIRRIFIDEITAVPEWERALKRLADQGLISDVLIITTGSKMVDLRRGTERLPGRKGKLTRTNFRFTPISYAEFRNKTLDYFKSEQALWAYILTGGSPVAINALISDGFIPNYIIELTRDWVFSETSLQGRSIGSIKSVIHFLMERGGLSVSLHAVAKETGLANNTVALGYIDLLKDLGCVSSCSQLEANKLRPIPRKASKYHFTYLLFVTTFMKNAFRTIGDLESLPPDQKGKLIEWLIAAEIWRRAAIQGEDEPEQQFFWTNGQNEIDFLSQGRFIEVKSGLAKPSEFIWFSKTFPKRKLEVICPAQFDLGFCSSISLDQYLLEY